MGESGDSCKKMKFYFCEDCGFGVGDLERLPKYKCPSCGGLIVGVGSNLDNIVIEIEPEAAIVIIIGDDE